MSNTDKLCKDQFTQIHLLTPYPASNLNRDSNGKPKTMTIGNTQRGRVSSQCQKSNWRTSAEFKQQLNGCIGTRTKRQGVEVLKKLKKNKNIPEENAKTWAKKIAEQLGKLRADKEAEIEQLVHISPAEEKTINDLVEKISKEELAPNEENFKLLTNILSPENMKNMAVDIALWGRMLAKTPKYNVEAACQVAHSFTVHTIAIEDDYFTALDELNYGTEDSGAGHVDDAQFTSGLFYSYICINNELLLKNLNGDKNLAKKTIDALIKTVTKVSPSGKQNSFASRAYACYALVEVGSQQPRSLALAFMNPIGSGINSAGIITPDYPSLAIEALENQRKNFNSVYGSCTDESKFFNAVTGEGKLDTLVELASGVFNA